MVLKNHHKRLTYGRLCLVIAAYNCHNTFVSLFLGPDLECQIAVQCAAILRTRAAHITHKRYLYFWGPFNFNKPQSARSTLASPTNVPVTYSHSRRAAAEQRRPMTLLLSNETVGLELASVTESSLGKPRLLVYTPTSLPSTLCRKLQCENQQNCIRRYRQCRQHHDNISAGSEPFLAQPIVSNFGKELLVSLMSAEERN